MIDLDDLISGKDGKRAVPVEIIVIGLGVVAVLFAGRIMDLLLVPIIAAGSFWLGHRKGQKK